MRAKPYPDTVPQVTNGRINGRFAPGFSGNPGGSPEATRRAFNKRFLLDLAEDWQQHGREVFKRVRRESPAAYLKVCAMLVPKEMQIEHKGGIKAMLAARAGETAKVIEGEAEVVPSLPAPARPTKASRSGAWHAPNSATCSGRHSRRRIESGGSEGEATKLFAAVSA